MTKKDDFAAILKERYAALKSLIIEIQHYEALYERQNLETEFESMKTFSELHAGFDKNLPTFNRTVKQVKKSRKS